MSFRQEYGLVCFRTFHNAKQEVGITGENGMTRIRTYKKLSCRRETARHFVSLNILQTHSRSFEVTLLHRSCVSSYYYFNDTMSVCCTVSEIFSVKQWRYLATRCRGRSRSLKMAPFDTPYTTFYWSAIVSIAVCCTIFKLFDVE